MRGEGKEVFKKTNEGLRVEYGQKAKRVFEVWHKMGCWVEPQLA